MGWIISVIVLTLVAGVGLLYVASGAIRLDEIIDNRKTGVVRTYRAAPALAIMFVWFVLIAIATTLQSYEKVDAGQIGIVRAFGAIDGQISEGANFIPPWKSVERFDIRVQKAEFRTSGDEGLRALGRIEAASVDTQDVFMNITVNWRVSPDAVQDLVREVGPNFFEVLVPTRVQQFTKAETVKWTAVQVTQNREVIRENIETALQADLGQFSITVVSIQIDNISYQPQFSQAIEDKQTATQRALEAEEIIKQREAEARQTVATASGAADAAIETARGEAERVRVEAQGEADAIRLRGSATADANREIAQSLTADLIQFEALKQLDGVSIALLPADGNFLLDPSGILGRGTAPVAP